MGPRGRAVVASLCLLALVACGGSDSGNGGSAGGLTTTLPAVEGEAFPDPQGSYVLTVPPDWKPVSAPEVEIEAWAVGPKRRGFTPNVNVLTQTGVGPSLEAYLDLSFEDQDAISGLEVLDRGVVTGPDGQELGVIWYSASPGDAPISFLAYVTVRSDRAVVATLSALPDSFDEFRREVEPYLLTLRATT